MPADASSAGRLDPAALPPLRDVVRRDGLDARKALGQNFLFDLNLTGRIAREAGSLDGVDVVEIGPGPGGLTRALLAQGARVVAVERDERCRPALDEIAAWSEGRLTVHFGDALRVDPASLLEGSTRPARIVANLPYNIGTALLVQWLTAKTWPPRFDRFVLMFQREVADRIIATPATREAYGRLGVLCGWRTQARVLFDVAPAAFTPAPKVTSAVVEFVPRANPLPCRATTLGRVTQAAFGQRRKMLRQSLRQLGDAAPLLAAAGLDGTMRAEEVDIAGFVALARAVDADVS